MDEDILNEEEIDIPSQTYKVVNSRIVGIIDDKDAMRQAIDKILRTNRFAYQIYEDTYGSEIEDLIGEDMDLVKAEIERLIGEALLADDRVLEIVNFTFLNETKDSLFISFEVSTVFGSVEMNQEVVV